LRKLRNPGYGQTVRLALLAALAAACALAGAATAQASVNLPAGFQEVTLASGFDGSGEHLIVDLAWAPDGRMFVADRTGVVYVHSPGDPVGTNSELLDIGAEVNNAPGSDRGLLGIAVDKDFASNGYLYLLYTYDKDGTDSSSWQVSRLTRVTVHPNNTVDGNHTSTTETPILGQIPATYGTDPNVGVCGAPSNTNQCIPSEGTSHSVGTVRVAPDGTLFVGTGDGNDYTIVDPLAFKDNNPETYRGKIMHVDTGGNGLPGHPFCRDDDTLTDVCTKVYAMGLRNPFRFTVRPGGGLAIGDVGEDAWEEFDLSSGGEDFGWPCWEGNGHTNQGHDYSSTDYCKARYADQNDNPSGPIFAWQHLPYPIDQSQCNNPPRGNTAIGGPTYMGDQYPAGYRGTTFFGDYMCGWLQRAVLDGSGPPTMVPFATSWGHGVDLESAPDGNLAYINDNVVHEVVYGPGNHRPAVSPSATATGGLGEQFASGAVDPDGDPLTYDWDFGDGSAHSSAAAPTHTYPSTGDYTATLTVDDGRGMSATGAVHVSLPAATPTTPAKPSVQIGHVRLRLGLTAGSARLLRRGLLAGSFSSADPVKTLRVSLWRGRANAKSCRWWSKRSHAFKRGSCGHAHWMNATLRRMGRSYTWKLSLGHRLGKGSYTIVLQALPRGSQLAPSARMTRRLRVR